MSETKKQTEDRQAWYLFFAENDPFISWLLDLYRVSKINKDISERTYLEDELTILNSRIENINSKLGQLPLDLSLKNLKN